MSKKRGISPLIGSVLIIAFVVILFVLITTWTRRAALEPGMEFGEEKVASTFEQANTNIKLMDFNLEGNDKIKIKISNEGTTSIKGIAVKVIGSSGSYLNITEFSQELENLEVINQEISFNPVETGDFIEKIEVTPIVSSGYAVSAARTKTIDEEIEGGTPSLKSNGESCSAGTECSSDYCVDGVCCNTACTEICKACDVTGNVGTCDNVPDGQTDIGCPDYCDGSGNCISGITGNIYYIDYEAGDDANDGLTTSTAWKLAPGMNGFSASYTHQPGDKFIFKGGVTWDALALPLTITYSGDATNSDEYTVDQTWYSGSQWTRPEFDGNGIIDRLIVIMSKNYLVFQDLRLTNNYADATGDSLFRIGNSLHVTIERCDLEIGSAVAFEGIVGIYADIGTDYLTINENNIYGTGGTGLRLSRVKYVTVSGNIIHDVYDGIVCNANQTDIYGNTIYNILDAPTMHEVGIIIQAASDNVKFYRNTLFNLGNHGTGMIELGSVGGDVPNNIEIYNNLLYDNARPGFWLTESNTVLIANNTVYQTAEKAIYTSQDFSNFQILNNIFVSPYSAVGRIDYDALTYLNHNSYHRIGDIEDDDNIIYYIAQDDSEGYKNILWIQENTPFEANGIQIDPLFVNPSDPLGLDGIMWTDDDGFIPQAGSPVCGAGENGQDIGAYECL